MGERIKKRKLCSLISKIENNSDESDTALLTTTINQLWDSLGVSVDGALLVLAELATPDERLQLKQKSRYMKGSFGFGTENRTSYRAAPRVPSALPASLAHPSHQERALAQCGADGRAPGCSNGAV